MQQNEPAEILASTESARPSRPDREDSGEAGPAVLLAMHRRIEELAQALREAQRIDAAKTSFLAMVSHELRTPLTAITGFSDAALHGIHGPLPEAYRSYFAAINGVGRHLGALVENLLDLAQIEVGRFSAAIGPVAVRPLVAEAGAAIAPLAERSGIDVAGIALDDDWLIEADATRVKQILLNLLANAVKFTPRDGKIGIEAAPSGAWLDLVVWDTGIGIAPEHQQRIFEAFYQLANKPNGNRGKGVGLGLAIARQLAVAMGGDILVASAPGCGSRFTLRLPMIGSVSALALAAQRSA